MIYIVSRVQSWVLSPPVLVGVGLLVASLGLYLSTLAPTLTWGSEGTGVDGGELLAAADTFGIAHPPGYPTYTLLLKSFATLVPVGDFAYRGNLLSAVLAAASVVTVYWASLLLCRSLAYKAPRGIAIVGAALGAATFAASPLLWSQAVITEVYTLNALFAGSLMVIASHLAIGWRAGRTNNEARTRTKLAVFGFLLGIGLGNHLTLLAVAVPLLYWLWSSLGWRRLVSPWVIGPFVLGAAVYVYVPLRAAQDPPINWGDADTLRGFVWMLTAQPYQQYVFGVGAGDIAERLLEWTELVFRQFNPLGLFFGLIGVQPLRLRTPAFFYPSLASIAAISVYSIMFSSVDYEVLMIPAFLLFSVWIGVGFFWTLSTVIRLAPTVQAALPGGRLRIQGSHQVILLSLLGFLLLPGVSMALNYGGQNLRGDRSAHDYATDILSKVPDGAVVLSDTERDVFSLWYMSYVENSERNIAVVAVRLLQHDWYLNNIHRRFPSRIPEMTVQDASMAIRRILEHGGERSRVFLTFTSPFLQQTYNLKKDGKVYEVTLK